MITQTTGILSPVPANIPEELRIRPQWVTWRPEERDGRLTKVPYCPSTDAYASSTDLMTWVSFETAWGAYEDSDGFYTGIGFVFGPDPYTFVDLDDCRRPSGAVAKWAQDIIDRVVGAAYVEVSASGTGIHLVLEGNVRQGGIRRDRVEIYSRGRYGALTGVLL